MKEKKYLCIGCKKELLEYPTQSFDVFEMLSNKPKQFYCSNKKCKRFGLLSIIFNL